MTSKNKKAESFWKALGSNVIHIQEKAHDAWVANSSHLPHALSFCLFQDMDSKYPQNPSLKDIARLAKSHPELWADIFLSNQEQVLKVSSKFEKSFAEFRKTLQGRKRNALVRFIQHANQKAS